VLAVALMIFGISSINWMLLILALLFSAAAFSTLGAVVSVAVREIFDAQTLANAFRFPMMFLGGVFVPLTSMPSILQVIARFLPLTYSIEMLHIALLGGSLGTALMDLAALAGFSLIMFLLAVRILASRLE